MASEFPWYGMWITHGTEIHHCEEDKLMLAMALETRSTLRRSLVLISLNFQGEIALITHATTQRVLSRPVALKKAFFLQGFIRRATTYRFRTTTTPPPRNAKWGAWALEKLTKFESDARMTKISDFLIHSVIWVRFNNHLNSLQIRLPKQDEACVVLAYMWVPH